MKTILVRYNTGKNRLRE